MRVRGSDTVWRDNCRAKVNKDIRDENGVKYIVKYVQCSGYLVFLQCA